jgi:hypothetical protein
MTSSVEGKGGSVEGKGGSVEAIKGGGSVDLVAVACVGSELSELRE